MTYFTDLSPYSYLEEAEGLVNVGWLGRGHSFVTGDVADIVVESLLYLSAVDPRNVTRGFHYCEFCDVESPIRLPVPHHPELRTALGAAEIHVSGDEVAYAAPDLMIHYIQAHRYRPPDEFCQAVTRSAKGSTSG